MTAPMVFSVRPVYVDAFRRGDKGCEFRTRRPSVRPGEMVLIYETAPVSMIVAEATVGAIVDAEPDAVWDQAEAAGGIIREAFDRYFAGRSRAVAIWLAVRWLAVPRPLPDGMRAPQSWARLTVPWVSEGQP